MACVSIQLNDQTKKGFRYYLPVSLLSHRNISVFTLVMTWINTSKYNFTSLPVLGISIKPERENRFFYKALLNNIVPVNRNIIDQSFSQ